jgi:hypothetical protein
MEPPATPEALEAMLEHEKLLMKHAQAIVDRALPAIMVAPSQGSSRLGGSRLGGAPDLPRGVAWPRFVATRAELDKRYLKPSVASILDGAASIDVPFAFVGQFRLEDLVASDVARRLPATGLLAFFFRPDLMFEQRTTGKNWRYHLPCAVVHSDAAKVSRAKPPPELAAWASPARPVAFSCVMVMPDYEQLAIDLGRGAKAYIARSIAQLALPEHQLLTFPTGTHDTDVPPRDGHVLFSTRLPEAMFDGAFSCAYFCISDDALRRRAFEQAYVLISSE